jgi:hypothetical protein
MNSRLGWNMMCKGMDRIGCIGGFLKMMCKGMDRIGCIGGFLKSRP